MMSLLSFTMVLPPRLESDRVQPWFNESKLVKIGNFWFPDIFLVVSSLFLLVELSHHGFCLKRMLL